MRKIFLFSAVFLVSALLQIMLTGAAISSTFPIATTANREMSVSAAFDGTNYLVGIQGDAVDKHNITAQLVSQSGAMVGSRISVGRSGGVPFIAFDGGNYLMVWTDDDNNPNDDVYGQFISKTGALVGSPFPISQAAGKQTVNSIMFDGTNYLVVWEDSRNWNDIDDDGQCDTPDEGTCIDIYGRFVSPSGSLIGKEISISKAVQNQKFPFLSFDGTSYLAVWVSRRTGSSELWDIKGRFISKTGTLSGVLTISQTPSPSYNPVYTALDGKNYFVVWNRDIGNGYPDPTIWDVYGRLVSPSGSFPGSEFAITTATGNQFIAGPVYDGNKYLVFWTDARNDTDEDGDCDAGEGTCLDIYGQYVTKTGTLVGTEFLINKDAGNQFGTVIFGGGTYLVLANYFDVWEGSVGDVYGMFIIALPILPTKLEATSLSSTQVKLTWKHNLINVTGFKIYRKKGSGSWTLLVTKGKNALSHTDNDAPGNTTSITYSYYIQACNSSECSAKTNTAIVPYRPTNLSATPVSSSKIDLQWTDKSNNETGFEIERKNGSCSSTDLWSKIATVGQNIKSYGNTGLSSHKTYSYRVRAYKKSSATPYAYGYSSYLNCKSATTR